MPMTSMDQNAAKTRNTCDHDWFHLSTVCDTVVGAGSEEMQSWLLGGPSLLTRGLAFPRVLPGRAGPVPSSKLCCSASGGGPLSLWTGASCSSIVAVEDPPDMTLSGSTLRRLSDLENTGDGLGPGAMYATQQSAPGLGKGAA